MQQNIDKHNFVKKSNILIANTLRQLRLSLVTLLKNTNCSLLNGFGKIQTKLNHFKGEICRGFKLKL